MFQLLQVNYQALIDLLFPPGFASVTKRKLKRFRLRVSKASGFELSRVLIEDMATVDAVTVVWKIYYFTVNSAWLPLSF